MMFFSMILFKKIFFSLLLSILYTFHCIHGKKYPLSNILVIQVRAPNKGYYLVLSYVGPSSLKFNFRV